jgi:hypothetical protein
LRKKSARYPAICASPVFLASVPELVAGRVYLLLLCGVPGIRAGPSQSGGKQHREQNCNQ